MCEHKGIGHPDFLTDGACEAAALALAAALYRGVRCGPAFQRRRFPAAGDDFKIMGVRQAASLRFTVAVAPVDREIASAARYHEIKQAIAGHLSACTPAGANAAMAGEICEALPEVREASVQLVAQIGRPVSAPLACFVEIIARDAITESCAGASRDRAGGPRRQQAARVSAPSVRDEILQHAQQCIRGEGLAQHQIGADIRCKRQIVPFGDSPSPRHGDDLHLRERGLEPMDELDPVALGHEDVGDEHIDGMRALQIERAFSVRRNLRLEARSLQHDLDERPHVRIVVHDQN
jgi:S-adenosylmethionine synthetase (AdoMet synthetase)